MFMLTIKLNLYYCMTNILTANIVCMKLKALKKFHTQQIIFVRIVVACIKELLCCCRVGSVTVSTLQRCEKKVIQNKCSGRGSCGRFVLVKSDEQGVLENEKR